MAHVHVLHVYLPSVTATSCCTPTRHSIPAGQFAASKRAAVGDPSAATRKAAPAATTPCNVIAVGQ
eukprot:365048-Chlamydomonas_euryale.AAC.11